MSIDYRAHAGYGIDVRANLTDDFRDILNNKYNKDLSCFIESVLPDFDYVIVGNLYSSDVRAFLCSEEPDIIKFPNEFNDFKKRLECIQHILINIEPKWFCEILIC